MKKNIKIGMILEFLNKNGFNFSFKGDPNADIVGFSSLFKYKPETITFIVPERSFSDFENKFRDESITLIIIGSLEKEFACFKNIIVHDEPRKVFFAIVEKFFDENIDERGMFISSKPEIYTKYSYVSENAEVGKNVTIGAGCIIEGNVKIGNNTVIHHNVVIRNQTKIGSGCSIFSGTVIGESGFNFTTDSEGNRNALKHYGGVVIEDNVQIGDNCCVIRGAIDDTVIQYGAKLNTMVHVAHNVIIGKNTVVTMPTHFCGSVTIGNNCHIAASVIRNQVSIGDNAVLGLGSVVVKDVESGQTAVGNPAKILK